MLSAVRICFDFLSLYRLHWSHARGTIHLHKFCEPGAPAASVHSNSALRNIDFHILQGHVALGAMERKDIIHLREGLCQTSNEENRGNSLLRATKQPCVAPCCRTSQDTGGGDLSIGKGH